MVALLARYDNHCLSTRILSKVEISQRESVR